MAFFMHHIDAMWQNFIVLYCSEGNFSGNEQKNSLIANVTFDLASFI